MDNVNTSSDTLAERIRRAGPLASGERAVAAYLQRHPEEAAVSSAAKLGKATGTSDATVIRTARKLGFAGLGDLKRSLVQHLARRRDPAQVLDDRVQRLHPAHAALQPVIDAGRALLGDVPALVDSTAWTRAVDVLNEAEHVWAYGIGPGAALADQFALSLRRAGKASDAWTATGFRLADDLLRLQPAHAVVVIAPLRLFREIGIVLDHAHRTGAHSVLLTEATDEAKDTRAGTVLPLPDSTEGAANELLAPLALLHALVLQLVTAQHASAVDHYQRLNTLRTEITGTELDLSRLPEP
ncbi:MULTISPECIES: MurR/RpiR family transcriptional regulator [Streptomyces]|uniref:Transcriptional regulator n=1 Tax=Streptomyces cacaoi TaxID=1898 RepID=A0A4Y3QVM0_STRCI|nr:MULTISPECIES: MurR/RpiR family transcriptional regulator [Streptomyces]NNG83402.1 MurR/RpiR family transcriptional regulator [Streptomyces cacaoi]QHF95385.1 MurR/RpiR family transcriptional regulator [Streptomyces sp. NHF165]GEB49262.1 transcriptional regulator [Streptomyces cacaoi]